MIYKCFLLQKLRVKYQNILKSSTGASTSNGYHVKASFGALGSRRLVTKGKQWDFSLSVADGDRLTAETAEGGSGNTERSISDDRISDGNLSSLPPSNGSPAPQNEGDASTLASASASTTSSPSSQQERLKRSPLTARERLRAARVLSRYNTDSTSKPAAKPDLGSKVLDALRESDRGKKKGLPEAPGNMLDDSKRGLPPKGLTFQFPGGNDLFVIVFSFVFISTVMFATTFIVWKVGAIHFNEY